MDKQIIKKHTAKLVYLIIGVFISLSIYSTNAAWNSTVTTGQTLTGALWNDMVNKLVDLDNRVTTVESADAGLKYLASGSDWSEEARIILNPNGTFSEEVDHGYNGQSVNVKNAGWNSSVVINEIIFEVDNFYDSYCVGSNGTLSLTGNTGTYPTCTRIYHQGAGQSSASVNEDDWISLFINGVRQSGCQNGGYHRPHFGARCSYPVNGVISSLRIEEADWSEDFGAWNWRIWYR